MPESQFDHLIIGNSVAAVGAIEAIRSVDDTGSIGVVSSEAEYAYSRPLITYLMAGKVAEDNIGYRPPDFYKKTGVDLILGREARSVDDTKSTVELDDGTRIAYRGLLLAAGGAPIPLRVDGADRPGVFFMNTIADARKAKGWLAHCDQSVVVGAGLTGLKTAEALAQLGQTVTVVDLADRVLPAAVDAVVAEMVQKRMAANGVEVLTEVGVTKIEGGEDTNDVQAVRLSTGEAIACDTVFVTIGVRPRIEIVQGSSIKTGTGILVDKHMRTNVDNVYAAGDIAEAYDPLMDQKRVVPILTNAYIGGRVAALNMVGKDAEFNIGMSVNSVSFFGLTVMSAGFAAQEEDDEFRVISRVDGENYRKFVLRGDRLMGMILTGNVERAGLLTGIMRAGISVEGLEDALLSGDLGLINLPREVIEERIHSSGRNWL